MMGKKNIAFLVSGRGSNFHAVARMVIDGNIKANLGILISDNKEAKALDLAQSCGMNTLFIDPLKYASRELFDKEIVRVLKKAHTDLVVAAGYMRLLTPYFVKKFQNRIINIHPSLLPAFPGLKAQKQAINYGVKVSGCTAHFVDEGTDTGPIIIQSMVPVLDDDTEISLSSRILKEEHHVLPKAVSLFCENRLRVVDKRVYILK